MSDDLSLALCRLLLALPDVHRIGAYWHAVRRFRAAALAWHGAAVAPAVVIHQGVYIHRGLAVSLGKGAELRDRVRLGIDEPGLRAGSFSLGAGSIVLSDSHVDCSAAVSIGRGTHVGRRNLLLTHHHDVRRRDVAVLDAPIVTAPLTIGDDVMLFGDVVVFPGVTIGDGAVVGIRSVVTRDVPAYTIVAGVPAKPIGRRN